jgi:hypothetical protein
MKAGEASTPDSVVVPFLPTREARARLLRRERLKAPRRRVREKIVAALELLEAVREDLIARLDAIDGDPDLELTCEDEGAQVDAESDDADGEPELGSQEGGPGGTRWDHRRTFYSAEGTQVPRDWPTDGEIECEDEGAQCDEG